MKQVSEKLQKLTRNAGLGVRAYASPLAVCFVITLCVLCMEFFHGAAEGIDALFSAQPLFQSLWVTLAFSFTASAAAQRWQGKMRYLLLHLSPLAVFAVWFLFSSQYETQFLPHIGLIRLLLILLLYCTALCLLPAGDGQNFSRFLIHAAAVFAAAFCAVSLLFLGVLMLTLAAGSFLGNANLEILPVTAAILYGIVLPLLVCGAFVPKDHYPPLPKALRVFVSAGLVPILAALGVIFYLYLGKILLTNVWPSNEVSPYVIFGSCVGLAFLVFFCGAQEDRAAKPFLRLFPLFWLLPLAMLFVCAAMRIADQGLTPRRALLLIFGLWVLICLTFAFFKKENFHGKVLPIAAAILLVLALSCPYCNIFSLSKHAQLARLDRALEAANMGEHSSISCNANAGDEEKRVILSSSDYLLYETNAKLTSADGVPLSRDNYDAVFGFSNIPQMEYVDDTYFYLEAEPTPVDVREYALLIPALTLDETVQEHMIGSAENLGDLYLDDGFCLIVKNGAEKTVYPLGAQLLAAVQACDMGFDSWNRFDLEDLPLTVVIHNISGSETEDGTIELYHVEFDLLVAEE